MSHYVPNFGSLLVSPDIPSFCARVQDEDVERADSDEVAVAATVYHAKVSVNIIMTL